jgi:hypothetical protein
MAACVASLMNAVGSHVPNVADCTRRFSSGEGILGELARHLGVPAVTLHRWRKGGWARARKLPTAGGLWAVWATGAERRRMGRLRRFQKEHPNQPIPAVLTTPQPKATR